MKKKKIEKKIFFEKFWKNQEKYEKKSIFFRSSNSLGRVSFGFFTWIKVQNVSKKHNLSISEHIGHYKWLRKKWRNDEIWCPKTAKWAIFCIFGAFYCLTRPQSGMDWVVNEVGWGWKLFFQKLQALSFILVKKSSKNT